MLQFLDLWSHPLISEKWAPIVRSYALCNYPVEMVLPGRNGPSQVRMGIAVFKLSHEAPHEPARMLDFRAPILRLDEVVAVSLDIPTDKTAAFTTWLAHNDMKNLICRHPVRSPLTTKERPRVSLQLLFPQDCSEFEQVLTMKELRRATLTQDTYFGFNTLHTSPNALILEVNSPLGFCHCWPLCSQLPLNKNKVRP